MKITIFTIPKPFEGHIGIIQRNAIKSWLNLVPQPDIILFGDEKGVKETAAEFGIKHYPDVRKNEHGTPYINTVFSFIDWVAQTDIVCYSNCDDIFVPFMIKVLDVLREPMKNRFLVLGERKNVDIVNEVDFKDPDIMWSIEQKYTLQQFPGIDYFIYPKGTIKDMPDFLVGRAGWDNWVIYDCRKKGIPVIDASIVINVYHQNHDYAHVKNKKGDTWKGSSESKDNLKLVKNRYIYLWELADSDYIWKWLGIQERPFSYRDILQWIVLYSPEWMHWIIEPVFRAGHNTKWVYLNVKERLKKDEDNNH